jgi:hypothetical protein
MGNSRRIDPPNGKPHFVVASETPINADKRRGAHGDVRQVMAFRARVRWCSLRPMLRIGARPKTLRVTERPSRETINGPRMVGGLFVRLAPILLKTDGHCADHFTPDGCWLKNYGGNHKS